MWEEKLNEREKPKELPTFAEFKNFLEMRFRTLEGIDQQHQSSSQTSRNSSNKQTFIAYAQQDKSISNKSGTAPLNAEAPSFDTTNTCMPSTSSNITSHHSLYCSTNKNIQVLLATALVKVKSSLGEWWTLRALLDSGSEASFITEFAVQLLRLKPKQTTTEVSGLGLVSSGTCLKVVDITFASHHTTFATSTQAFIFKSLSGHLPARSLHVENWTDLNGLTLADPEFYKSAKIDLLLGSDVLTELLLPDLIQPEDKAMPIIQKTMLGWILFGKAPLFSQPSSPVRSFMQTTTNLETELRRFWELEETPFKQFEKSEDVECELHFINNVQRTADGRYQVAIPFKGNVAPTFGESFQGALRRFQSVERRLATSQQLQQQYTACIEEYIQLGHMTEIDQQSVPVNKHYFLPHHAVFKESSSTTKLRVVFDASFKTSNGVSLNNLMMTGPALQQNICDIILRWRLYRYTFTADIEKMYRQIWIAQNDRNYQLMLWRKRSEDPIKVYRLNTVTFGTAAAPYLAIRTLLKLAEDNPTNELASIMIHDEMYVDDLISGGHTVDEGKWTSNSNEVLEGIPTGDRETTFSVPSEESKRVKTLGVHWLPAVDQFSFYYASLDNPQPTKRFILSTIARLFDPMGWIAPCISMAKMFMQQLWIKKVSWDEPIEPSILKQWAVFYEDLKSINELQFPRWVETSSNCERVELHGFSDASEKAYGASVYLRVEDKAGKVKMHLLIAKSKVAPVQPISLPRLELCGAVILAKLLEYVDGIFKIKGIKMFAWTDSTITLSWIRGSPNRWETFVRNRVGEIQRLTSIKIWNHIPTLHNPADLISRGVLPSVLANSDLWWNGPNFLQGSWNFPYPDQPEAVYVHTVRQVESEATPCNEIICRISDLNKLIRIIASMFRFVQNASQCSSSRKKGLISNEELNARFCWCYPCGRKTGECELAV